MQQQEEQKKQAPVQKCNTTSSVFIGSTISSPNMKEMIKSMAKVIVNQMLLDTQTIKKFPKDHTLQFFNEEKYIKDKPDQFSKERLELLRTMPTEDHVFEFIYAICMIAEFSHESTIISLVFLFRFTNKTSFPLFSTTWRPLVFTSLLVAQKVIDDVCLKNADFLQVYPFWDIKECNRLESKFLSLLDYEVNVGLQLYLQYFYELRSLCKKEELFPKNPISAEQADILEIKSKKYAEQERLKESMQTKSLDYQNHQSKQLATLD